MRPAPALNPPRARNRSRPVRRRAGGSRPSQAANDVEAALHQGSRALRRRPHRPAASLARTRAPAPPHDERGSTSRDCASNPRPPTGPMEKIGRADEHAVRCRNVARISSIDRIAIPRLHHGERNRESIGLFEIGIGRENRQEPARACGPQLAHPSAGNFIALAKRLRIVESVLIIGADHPAGAGIEQARGVAKSPPGYAQASVCRWRDERQRPQGLRKSTAPCCMSRVTRVEILLRQQGRYRGLRNADRRSGAVCKNRGLPAQSVTGDMGCSLPLKAVVGRFWFPQTTRRGCCPARRSRPVMFRRAPRHRRRRACRRR